MKKIFTTIALITSLGSFYAQDTTSNRLISVTAYPNRINFFRDTISQLTTVDIDSVTQASTGSSSAGFAIFINPINKKLITVADSLYNGGNRNFYDLNPFTGKRKLIMSNNKFFTSFETTNTGRVFGVIGQNTSGTDVSGDLYEFNLTTKTSTLVTNIPTNSNTKTALGFNPVNSLLYGFSFHWGGGDTITTINLSTFAKTRFVTDFNGEQIDGAYYLAPDTFLLSSYNGKFLYYKISTNSIVKIKSNLNDNQKDATKIDLINSAATRSYCAGDSLLLPTYYSGNNYHWYKNGVAIANATNDSFYVKTPGVYKVLADITPGKAIWSESINVTQLSLPVVNISTPQGTSFCQNDSVKIVGTFGGTYQWYKNGTLLAGATSNTYTVKNPGHYNMIKTNANGCKDSASVGVNITVNPLPVVSIASQTVHCTTETQFTLTGGSPSGGNYSGTGVISNSSFNPSASGAGSYLITYSYTDANSCVNTATTSLVVSVCSGLTNINKVIETVYPNPFNNQLNLQLSSSNSSIELIDAIGNVVLKKQVKSNETLELSNLANGIYSLKISTNDHTTVIKVVKQ